jgi:hypothetical protein
MPGVILQRDFVDYYDDEVCSTPYGQEIVLDRTVRREMTYKAQYEKLVSAGFNTPMHGSKKIIYEHLLEQYELMFKGLPDSLWQENVAVLYVNEEQKLVKTTLKNAGALDGETFLIEFKSSKARSKGHVFRYVHIGDMGIWLDIKRQLSWSVGQVMSSQHQCNIIKPSRLNPEHLRHFQHPLFSIDFLCSDEGPLAIRYNERPNLGNMGIMNVMDKEEVASHLLLGMLPVQDDGMIFCC